MSEFTDFDEWYRARYKDLFVADDEEIREWSLFMGYRVSPIEIADLRAQLATMLERECFDARQGGA